MEIVANGSITSVEFLFCGLVSSWISINCQNTLNGISFVFCSSKNINPIHCTNNIPQKSFPFPICISSVVITSLLLAKSLHPFCYSLVCLLSSLHCFPYLFSN